jgi:hypothetical protein
LSENGLATRGLRFFLEISVVAIWGYLLFALAAGAMLPI